MSMYDLPHEALFQFTELPSKYREEVEFDGTYYYLTFCDGEEGYDWCLEHAVCWTSLDEDEE